MADKFGLKIGLEGEKEFKSALADINSQFKVLKSEMNLVTSAFDKNDKSAESLTARNKVLTKEIEEQKQKVEVLRSALDNASQSFGENDKRTQNWQVQLNNAEAALNEMERELGENEDALDNMGKEADEAGGHLEGLGSVAKGVGAAIGAAMVAVGAAVAAVASKINETVEVYANFEDSMLQVAATMGISAEEIAGGSEAYEKLTNAAKEAGASTRYSASEAGEALNYLALAGYDADKAVETLPKVLNLAAAGGMELATTSDLVTDAMSALQMGTENLDVFMDQMAKTSQKSNTSVQQLGEAILVCAGTATSTGQDLTTLNTSLGVLADNGIKGAEGGTKLRNVMLSLSSPTDKASKQLAELGVSVYDAEGNMRQMDAIMGDLNKSLESLSQDERTNAINNIFNKTDLNAVNALLASTTGRFEELSGQIEDCSGAAEAMANTMEAGLAGTTRSFNSAMEGMQIEVGSIFADFKQTLMSDSIDVVRSFTQNLQAANGDWGKIGQAIGQALGDVINLVGSYLPKIVEMAMQIISALGSALMDNLDSLLETAQSIIMTLLEGIISALPKLVEAAAQIIVSVATGIADALPTLIPTIVQVIITIVQTLIDNLPQILSAALALIRGLAQGILDALPVLIAALPQIILSIVDFILGAIPEIIDTGIQLLTSLVAALPDIITAIVEAIPQIIDGIITAVLDAIPLIIDAGIKLLVALIQALPQIIVTIVNAIPQIISSIIDALIKAIPQIIEAGVTLFIALIQNLPTIIVEIVKAVPQIISGIVSAFGSLMYKIVEIGGNIVKGLWQGIQSLASWLWDKVSGWISGIWNGIMNFFGIHSPSRKMAWIGEMLVEGLSGSILANGDEAVAAAEDMANDVLSAFNGLGDSVNIAAPTISRADAAAQQTANMVNGIVSGLSSLLSGGAGNNQPIILQVVLDSKTIAQSVFDPLRNVALQRGVSLG